MEASLSLDPRATAAADRPGGEPAMRAAAARMIARTRLVWAAPAPDVSRRGNGRPRLELEASRALDHQPRTGD
jgi:hypothetical protein